MTRLSLGLTLEPPQPEHRISCVFGPDGLLTMTFGTGTEASVRAAMRAVLDDGPLQGPGSEGQS